MTDIDILDQEIEDKKAEIKQLDAHRVTLMAEVTRHNEYIEQLKVEIRCVNLEPTDNLYRIWGEETGHQHWQYVFATSFEAAMELYTLTQENDIGKVELVVRNYCLTGKTGESKTQVPVDRLKELRAQMFEQGSPQLQELIDEDQHKRTIVDEALDKLYNEHGGVTLNLLIAASADRDSPLHQYFNWIETKNGRRDRYVEAYKMIMDSKMAITYQETREGLANKTVYGPPGEPNE